ncbi:MAG: glycosyltransferase family 39 protein, partial [Caldilinea sp.]
MAERKGAWAGLRGLWPELTILAVAVWTRLWQLDYHSFWFDEAVSLRWARSDANYLWQSTLPLIQDKHPPGYYLLLHGWINLLEPLGLAYSDWALRLLGGLLGVLTVVGLWLLARRLSGRSVALLAAALTALSPVLVWYSQELRMFQPATTGIVWAGYALLRGWQGQRALARLGWWA